MNATPKQPRPARKCPICGSERVVRIAYGYPGPEMARDAAAGKYVLGGCCVGPDSPKWMCRDCEHAWGRADL